MEDHLLPKFRKPKTDEDDPVYQIKFSLDEYYKKFNIQYYKEVLSFNSEILNIHDYFDLFINSKIMEKLKSNIKNYRIDRLIKDTQDFYKNNYKILENDTYPCDILKNEEISILFKEYSTFNNTFKIRFKYRFSGSFCLRKDQNEIFIKIRMYESDFKKEYRKNLSNLTYEFKIPKFINGKKLIIDSDDNCFLMNFDSLTELENFNISQYLKNNFPLIVDSLIKNIKKTGDLYDLFGDDHYICAGGINKYNIFNLNLQKDPDYKLNYTLIDDTIWVEYEKRYLFRLTFNDNGIIVKFSKNMVDFNKI